MTVPAVLTWDVDRGTRKMLYSFVGDAVWTAPGTVPMEQTKPDMWIIPIVANA